MVKELGSFHLLGLSRLKFNMEELDEAQRLIRYLPPLRYRFANSEFLSSRRTCSWFLVHVRSSLKVFLSSCLVCLGLFWRVREWVFKMLTGG